VPDSSSLDAAERQRRGALHERLYGADGRESQRVEFVNRLGSEWLPALPDVDERLRRPRRRARANVNGGH
jgi:hypothetical protein